ncbi:MAG TPA: transglutaminase family protein, partial [Polyangiales bacterium]|nr:transglutaminase family protein [Polyangiales bacterium]
MRLSPQLARLRPAPHTRTRIASYALHIQPDRHFLHWQQDPYGNFVARITPDELTRVFEVVVDLVAELDPINPFDFFVEAEAETLPFAYSKEQAAELAPCMVRGTYGKLFDALLQEVKFEPGARTVDYLVALNQQLQKRISYVIRLEHGVQEPEQTLTLARGSCRDTSWLLVQLLRHMGLAARFVSGYLIQLAADQKPIEGPSGPETDFVDLHAWCEVYLPGAGWIGFDPTSGLLAGEGHIPLACAPDPGSAAPVSGFVEPCEVDFAHEMRIERVLETPRVSKPYSEEDWQRIVALGAQIDEKLVASDVRLTMGGEPTFVSIDYPDAPEWTTDADGPHKRERADVLLRLLAARTMPGGLLHFGQGKWYPGEPLPRWAYGCYSRKDGKPLWREPSLCARGSGTSYGSRDAHAFATVLARRLEVDGDFVVPGYEDTYYYLWKERTLPRNLTPDDNRLDNPLERERIRRIFKQGLGHVVGYALPLDPLVQASGVRWRSGPMFFREETMWLLPGDSPMGYRLPLDSLPWVSQSEYPFITQADAHWSEAVPVSSRTVPPWHPAYRAEPTPGSGPGAGPGLSEFREATKQQPLPLKSAPNVIRTVLCIEARGGVMHVFLPPIELFDAYEHLVATIEASAAELGLPVRVEGYPPPWDPRVQSFSVTPDPGVIEVNVKPTASWNELRLSAETLYETARDARLCAEKFMIDGRHVGTGGGHHVVLGGPTPPDSPLLRRPDLLRSLVGYFHDHPSLSYMFSGLFIGPTSQAPRVDEARHESLHELEIAFAQLQASGAGTMPPWLVDRVFRHLLTDLTGNTHRTEFCIDKLYSPDGAMGRMGLLELRGFEMAPHVRMALATQALLRGLVARFWNAPYLPRLPRWGTQLHDRFMLPHFVEQDFRDVMLEMNDAGFAFDGAWFAPHLEFRFPHIGGIA